MAFNVQMDLGPFQRINPCGYVGLQVTQLTALGGIGDLFAVAQRLAPQLLETLGVSADAGESLKTYRTINTFSHDVSSR